MYALDHSTSSPRHIGPYRVLRHLGRGGQGETYLVERARALGPGHPFVARACLKRVLSGLEGDTEVAEAFYDEARLTAGFNHVHVVAAFDAGRLEDGSLYLVTRYVDGCHLQQLQGYLRSKHSNEGGAVPLPYEVTLHIATAVASALHYLHSFQVKGEAQQVVHRDIKPGNIMIDRSGVPQVIDFGTARALNNVHRTREGDLKGSLHYMSPEQASLSAVDRRADLWALGAVLYELLSGRPPFWSEQERTTAEMLAAILHADVKPLQTARPDVPEALAELVHQLLTKDPQKRPQHASEVLETLGRFNVPASAARDLAELVRQTQSDVETTPPDPSSSGTATRSHRRPPHSQGAVTADDHWATSPSASLLTGRKRTHKRRALWAALGCTTAALLYGLADISATESATAEMEGLPFLEEGSRALSTGKTLLAAARDGSTTRPSSNPAASRGEETAKPSPKEVSAPTGATRQTQGAAEEGTREPTEAAEGPAAPSPALPAAMPIARDRRATATRPKKKQRKSPPKHRSGASESPQAPQTGNLVVLVHDWAYVWLDGELLGPSPQRLEVPLGEHTLELAQDRARKGEVDRRVVKVGPGTNLQELDFGKPLI